MSTGRPPIIRQSRRGLWRVVTVTEKIVDLWPKLQWKYCFINCTSDVLWESNFNWLTNVQTNILTKYMEHSLSWEGNRSPDSQEVPRNLWNPTVHYPVYKSRLPVLNLSQINQVHVRHPTSSVSILVLSSHLLLGLSRFLFPTGLHTKTLYAPFLSFIRATCPAHFIFLVYITRMILYYQYK